MLKDSEYSRRDFIKISLGTGCILTVGISVSSCNSSTNEIRPSKNISPNAYITITDEGKITITVPESEMGQGVNTSIPMLIAEEMEVRWGDITVQTAPVDPVYGVQYTGGSTSIRDGWKLYRKAGATVREIFLIAAAKKWNVPVASCYAAEGFIYKKSSDAKLGYGELIELASEITPPTNIQLKDSDNFRIIGKSMPSLTAVDQIKGTTEFGIDINIPDMLVAAIAHSPVFHGKVGSFDATAAMKVSGVKNIVNLGHAVAVVATGYWPAKKGLDRLAIKWDNGKNINVSSDSIKSDYYAALSSQESEIMQNTGNTIDAEKKAAKIIQAEYDVPFQAHATMEPMCCTAFVRDGKCDVWVPTQAPTSAQQTAANAAYSKFRLIREKVKKRVSDNYLEDVKIHTTYLGGGFGRRLKQDYVAEAVTISKKIGKPVKLIWSREEDMQHDFYRPITVNRLTCGIDGKGKPLFWKHRIVGMSRYRSTGGAVDLPYNIPNIYVDYVEINHDVPIGSWRSVANSQNAFITESFMDEIAHLTKTDPLEFRLSMLDESPRYKAVLELAADKSGWGKSLPKNHYQGLALHKSYGSYVAQVAEISVSENNSIKVHRVVCCIDCGIAVNPDTIRAQMEGGIIFGLTATIKSAITVKNGRVEQSNFHDFPLIRIDETPQIEVHIIADSDLPGGVGEPGVPPIAPAITNAIFRATGKRIRKLPI